MKTRKNQKLVFIVVIVGLVLFGVLYYSSLKNGNLLFKKVLKTSVEDELVIPFVIENPERFDGVLVLVSGRDFIRGRAKSEHYTIQVSLNDQEREVESSTHDKEEIRYAFRKFEKENTIKLRRWTYLDPSMGPLPFVHSVEVYGIPKAK